MKTVLAFLCIAWSATAAEVPAGTRLEIRIKTRISSHGSRPHDPVEAAIIKPVMTGDRFLIPYAAVLRGEIESVQPSEAGRPAVLRLNFNQLAGAQGSGISLSTRLIAIDNARETVDGNGSIQGIAASQTPSARVDQNANADILQMAKAALVKSGGSEIIYEPGVEMTLELTSPVALEPGAVPGREMRLQPLAPESVIEQLVNSALIGDANLVFIGSKQQLQAALSAGGWRVATMLNKTSPRETFRDLADGGYREPPESAPLLDGRPADLSYQKQNDTYAKRHRLRIWLRPTPWQEQQVWAAVANEREKVISDLLGTGAVKSLALIDGKIAVLALGTAVE